MSCVVQFTAVDHPSPSDYSPSQGFILIVKMFRNFILAFPLLSLAYFSIATPLQEREASPGLIDDLSKGILSPIEQILKDVLDGVKSAINNEISDKPLICLPALDPCCVCQ